MNKSRLILILAALFATLGASAQLLYKVEGNGLTSPSYIFGTHHLAPISIIDSVGARAPFEQAAQVVGEIDMTRPQMELAQAMQPHMMAPADSTLSKVLSSDDYRYVSEVFPEYAPMPGMQLQMLEIMKPMAVSTMVAVNISAKAMPDYDPTQQLDSWFQTAGAEQGKQIVPLETADFQASVLFDSTPIAYQAEALVELLRDPQKAVESARRLTAAYRAGDLRAMEQIAAEDEVHPEFTQALLDRRNENWLGILPDIMQRGSAFIAVGALHLAGDRGIVEGLRKKGYTVTAVMPSEAN